MPVNDVQPTTAIILSWLFDIGKGHICAIMIFMPRKSTRGEVRKIIIELDVADPVQQTIWNEWQRLAENGQGSAWVREALNYDLNLKRGGYPLGRAGVYPEAEPIGRFENLPPRPPAPPNPLKAKPK